MSLCTPKPFAIDGCAAVAPLMHDHPFATPIAPGMQEPLVAHLLLLFVAGNEPRGTLS